MYLIDDGGAEEILVSSFPKIKMRVFSERAATFLLNRQNLMMYFAHTLCSLYFKAGKDEFEST
jgi:hypothetical protein